jgi:ribonuclease E
MAAKPVQFPVSQAEPQAEPQAELQPAAAPVVPEPVAEAPAIVFPVSAPSVAPVALAPAAEPAVAPAPAADLGQLLDSAGLTLAATDPEKLRAAREAAAQVPPPVRVPRTRKPLPPQADEPLIQVDTRQ